MDYFPILAYHKVSTQKEFGLTTVHPRKFKEQINILLNSGFSPITFSDISKAQSLPAKPVIITFDDGYESVYTDAFPIMQEFNVKGTVFVLSGYIGKYNEWEGFRIQQGIRHLNADQIGHLAGEGWEIGSHGINHDYLPAASENSTISQLRESKAQLSVIADTDIISFCYPFGRSDKHIQNLAEQAGYQFAVGNMPLIYSEHRNLLHLGRRSIYRVDNNYLFSKKLEKPSTVSATTLSEKLIRSGASISISRNILTNDLNK